MNENKNEIISSRVGGLGSSDAAMCYGIGHRGFLSDSDKLRIAVMLGLRDCPMFSTASTRLGDEVENKLFEYLKISYPNIVSNPKTESEELK